MSFAIASLILGGFSPITLFILYNAPPLASEHAIIGHSVMLLAHVCVIAFAGVMANRRLLGLLRRMKGRDATARAVLFSWLAGNLFWAHNSPGICVPSSALHSLQCNSFATIRFVETSTRRSGAPFDTSSSKQPKKSKPRNEPATTSIETTIAFANNFVFEPMPDPANPIRALENLLKYPGRIVHELHQTRAAILAAGSYLRNRWRRGLRNRRRRAIRWGADVDRSRQARTRHVALSVDLPAESLHFHLSRWDRRTTAQCLRRAFRSCLSELDFVNRFCAGRLDFFPIDRLDRFHGRAAFAFLGNRHPFRFAADRCDGPVSRCYEQRASQTMERHLHPRLFSNDDDAATNHCSVENISANGKEILPGELV